MLRFFNLISSVLVSAIKYFSTIKLSYKIKIFQVYTKIQIIFNIETFFHLRYNFIYFKYYQFGIDNRKTNFQPNTNVLKHV